MDNDLVRKAIRALTLQLSEFGDVQVFVSSVTPEGETIDVLDGMGNWNSRFNMVRDFVNRHETQAQMAVERDFCENIDCDDIADDDDDEDEDEDEDYTSGSPVDQ